MGGVQRVTCCESSKNTESLTECRGEGTTGGSSKPVPFTVCTVDQPLVPATPHSLLGLGPWCRVRQQQAGSEKGAQERRGGGEG